MCMTWVNKKSNEVKIYSHLCLSTCTSGLYGRDGQFSMFCCVNLTIFALNDPFVIMNTHGKVQLPNYKFCVERNGSSCIRCKGTNARRSRKMKPQSVKRTLSIRSRGPINASHNSPCPWLRARAGVRREAISASYERAVFNPRCDTNFLIRPVCHRRGTS